MPYTPPQAPATYHVASSTAGRPRSCRSRAVMIEIDCGTSSNGVSVLLAVPVSFAIGAVTWLVSSVVASPVLASAARAIGDVQARRAAGSASIGRRRAAGRRRLVRGPYDIRRPGTGGGRGGAPAGAKR